MSFISDFVHGVVHVVEQVVNHPLEAAAVAGAGVLAGEALVAATAPQVAAVGGAAAAVGAAATAPAAASAAAAGAVASNSLVDAVNPALSALSDIKDTVGSILGPIKDAFGEVTGFIKNINDTIIQPIVGPIKGAYDTINALVNVLHRDLTNGLKGILSIPGDIANAFGSLDATLTRAAAMLQAGNASSARAVFGALLISQAGTSLADDTHRLATALAGTAGEWTPPPVVSFGEAPDLQAFKAWAAEQQRQLNEGTDLAALGFQWLFKVVGVLEGLAAQREPYVELWREEIQKASAVKKLDPGTTQALFQRGELQREDALEELRVLGFSLPRASALLDLARTLPDSNRVASLFARGWLDNVAASAMLRRQGWSDEDATLLLNSSYTELDAGTLLELVRRGALAGEDASVALQRQGMRQFDSGLLLQTLYRLLGLADLLAYHDRLIGAKGAGTFAALTESPPADFAAYAQKLGIDAPSSQVLWSNHWRLLNPELAVQAFFRGFITRTMLDSALAQASIPPELYDNFIDLQRPLIPYRSIPTLVVQGIITQDEGFRILQQRGFDPWSADKLIQVEKRSATPSSAAQASHVHGLTVSVVLQLYDDGGLSPSEAQTMLSELGWAPEAISATLGLHDVKNAAAERASQVELILSRAATGHADYNDTVGQLQAVGLTSRELNKALAKANTQAASGQKLPSEAQMLKFWKQGIFDDGQAIDALRLLGYSQEWAVLLIQSEALGAPRPAKPAIPG